MNNKVILMGRLAKEPIIGSYSNPQGEQAYAKYTLAIENSKNVDYINCVCFGKSAEFVEKYYHTGMKISVEGHLKTGSYKNEAGQRIPTMDVMVESQEFVESKEINEKYAQKALEKKENVSSKTDDIYKPWLEDEDKSADLSKDEEIDVFS